MYKKFLEEFEDVDLEEINTEDKYASNDNAQLNKYNLKWKIYERYLAFKHAHALNLASLIDSDGGKVDGHECEYNYVIKHLASKYVNVSAFALALIFLLVL